MAKIRFDILSLFPESFSYLNQSILKKAQEKKLIEIRIWNIRDFAQDKHKTTDDYPYGGGPGMVMKIEPIYYALKKIKEAYKTNKRKIILTDIRGKIFNQKIARELAKEKQIIIICGHYEGVDERVKKLVDISLSIGKYVLTGGELPAMVIVDAVSRHIKGVLKNPLSLEEERYGILKSTPVYTRPEVFITDEGEKLTVPKVLLSGNHKKIEEWRKKHSKKIKI